MDSGATTCRGEICKTVCCSSISETVQEPVKSITVIRPQQLGAIRWKLWAGRPLAVDWAGISCKQSISHMGQEPEPELKPQMSPQMAAVGSQVINADVCHACDATSPPPRKNRRCRVYNWVGCEKCPRWYHTVCVNAKRSCDFVCDVCA